MSTYYYFVCKKCKEYGGFYSHQAWGWGNADFIDSFKFLMKHTDSCGAENLGIDCEYGLEELHREGHDYKENKTDYDRYNPRSDDLNKYHIEQLKILETKKHNGSERESEAL